MKVAIILIQLGFHAVVPGQSDRPARMEVQVTPAGTSVHYTNEGSVRGHQPWSDFHHDVGTAAPAPVAKSL